VALERALLLTFVTHALAMLSMALLLLPGMPGGTTADQAARIAYVAGHPWLWRLGWLPWQLTALSDLYLAWALLRARFVPRLPAVLAAVATVAAVVPDQMGQAGWITSGITLAQSDAAAYLSYESRIFIWTGSIAAILYTIAACGWSWCLASVPGKQEEEEDEDKRGRGQARPWTPALTVLSLVLWPLFLIVGLAPLFPHIGPGPTAVAAGNAAGFVLLEVWLLLAAEAVMRRSRPDRAPERWGRWVRWRHPRWSWLNALGNSRVARALAALLPRVALASDIRDVVYVSYIVPAQRLSRFVPAGLELQLIDPERSLALFTFLSYRHGGFGPRLFGRWRRRLFPSPIQSNWRVHVREPRTGRAGVYFLTTAIDSTPHALAGRLLVDGLPMHALAAAEVTEGDGVIQLRLDPGGGSGPDVAAIFHIEAASPTDGPWRACFATWSDLLAYVVPQDRAFAVDPACGRVTSLEITLGIPAESCLALNGTVSSAAARAIAGDGAQPFAFWVPRASFLFVGEASPEKPRK
jgi:hypothetical protein